REMPGAEKVRRHRASGPCDTASVEDSGAGERAAQGMAGPSGAHRPAPVVVGSTFWGDIGSFIRLTSRGRSVHTRVSGWVVGGLRGTVLLFRAKEVKKMRLAASGTSTCNSC